MFYSWLKKILWKGLINLKKILIAMFVFWLLMCLGAETFGKWIFHFLFISTDNPYTSIYYGLMLICGLIVTCTVYIVEEIRKIKFDNK